MNYSRMTPYGVMAAVPGYGIQLTTKLDSLSLTVMMIVYLGVV